MLQRFYGEALSRSAALGASLQAWQQVTLYSLQSAGLAKPAPKRSARERPLFCELYTDLGQSLLYTPKAGEPVSRTVRTQVSPRPGPARHPLYRGLFARGARPFGARAFEGLQGSLRKELALAGITIMAAANRWMGECYLPAHNEAFAVMPEQIGTASVRDRTASQVVCLQEEPGSVTKARQMARAHSANPS